MPRMKNILIIFSAALLLVSCFAKEPAPVKQSSTAEYFEKKPGGGDRKAGPGMMLMEQAEEDADPSADLIVIPPDPNKKKPQ